ncbi:MAG: NAD-dependent epimerase/dehydratase family protein [Candidatus Omnitrophica bacterium]|nr:NAD-dependent epimerase/dehydratase family protein [Candidatus Omnitrophota bacterium]
MEKIKIAIFGANSHIARGLINNFSADREFSLHLYTRFAGKINSFLESLRKVPGGDRIIHQGYEDVTKYPYDVIINCVGVGTLNKLQGHYADWFTVTEEYDNLAIEYLSDRADTLYISFSSGAVYGREFLAPAEENTTNNIRVNHIMPEDYYAIARLNAEAKHRALNGLKIIDLRVFSYFSRFIDLTDGYFITEILDCILKKRVFVTDSKDFIRDYVHPSDVYSIVKKCIAAGKINTALDVTSARPAAKKEILDYFSLEYDLQYTIGNSLGHTSATGSKNIYYSTYKNAARIGYAPAFSSMDTIKEESKYIIVR